MDQNDNEPHSTNDTNIVTFGLCTENADDGEISTNVLSNDENDKKTSKHKISPSKPEISKRMKANEEKKTEMAAVASNDEQSPDIYKLPNEVLVDTFDYLSLEDLCSIRQTSKRFHQVAGFCFQKNYSALVRDVLTQSEKVDAFHQYIQAVFFNSGELSFNYIGRLPEFQQLKKIELRGFSWLHVNFEDMKEILREIEYVMISGDVIKSKSLENIPRLFPNLKTLSILCTQNGSEWISCKYSKLERLEYTSSFKKNIEIGPFLEMNPNIRKLAIGDECLWNNKEALKAAKLDDLTIDLSENFESTHQLLDELYELGSYKRLKIWIINYSFIRDIHQFIELSSLHGLIKLHIDNMLYEGIHPDDEYTDRFAMSTFVSLEEFFVPFCHSINDIEATADNLKNLERIQFRCADLNDIIVFIKRSRKLTKIKVKYFVRTASFIKRTKEKTIYIGGHSIHEYRFERQKVINLLLLNTERAKLPNAKRITLYVTEDVYLATKWAMGATDYEFIQLKRFESFDWEYDFDMRSPY